MHAISSAQCTQMSGYTHMRRFAGVWAGRTWPANERCRTSPRNVSMSSHDPHNNDPGEKPRSSQSTSPLPAAASAAATKLLPPQHTSAAAAAAVATAANTPRACPGRLPRARRIAPRTPQRSGANGAALLALLASPTPVCPACAVWRAQERRRAAARARCTLCLDLPPHAQARAGAFDPIKEARPWLNVTSRGCEPGRHSVPHVAPAAPPSPGPAGRGEGLGWVGAAWRRDGRPARTRQPRRARAHRGPRPVPHGGRRRRRAYVARKGKRGGGALPAAALRSRGSAVLSAGRWMEGRRRKAAAAAGALPQLCACAPWAGACARSAADALGACSADALAYTQLAATLQTVSTIRTSSRA